MLRSSLLFTLLVALACTGSETENDPRDNPDQEDSIGKFAELTLELRDVTDDDVAFCVDALADCDALELPGSVTGAAKVSGVNSKRIALSPEPVQFVTTARGNLKLSVATLDAARWGNYAFGLVSLLIEGDTVAARIAPSHWFREASIQPSIGALDGVDTECGMERCRDVVVDDFYSEELHNFAQNAKDGIILHTVWVFPTWDEDNAFSPADDYLFELTIDRP